MLPYPVSTIARASGRLRFSAETTSSPLPSPSRKSTTAKAGALLPICASPSLTLSPGGHVKPALSQGAPQPFKERLVVFDDQERAVGRPGQFDSGQTRPRYLLCCTYGATWWRCQGRRTSTKGLRRNAALC